MVFRSRAFALKHCWSEEIGQAFFFLLGECRLRWLEILKCCVFARDTFSWVQDEVMGIFLRNMIQKAGDI